MLEFPKIIFAAFLFFGMLLAPILLSSRSAISDRPIILSPNTMYQKITLQELQANSEQLDGAKIELVGLYEQMLETSAIEGKIWLETSKSTVLPTGKTLSELNHVQLRVLGTISTKSKNYGHLGMYPFQLQADRIELIGGQENVNQPS
jgi:hypothetical protein